MPDSDRYRRSRRRPAVLAAACASFAAFAAAAPSPAAAYEQHFCQNVFMPSGSNCYAPTRHSLQRVLGFSVYSSDRVCAASFTSPGGTQNSDWRCDYTAVEKLFPTPRDGVGAIRNGDPDAFIGYGVQDF